LLKKEDTGNNSGPDDKKAYAVTVGGGTKWIPGHEGVLSENIGTMGQVYWFPAGPGVKANPNPNVFITAHPTYLAGNGPCSLSNFAGGNANTGGDYNIAGTTYWFREATHQMYGSVGLSKK
jgi:hypothetical protein